MNARPIPIRIVLLLGLLLLPAFGSGAEPVDLPIGGSVGDIKAAALVRPDPGRTLDPRELLADNDGFVAFDPDLNREAPPLWLKLHLRAPADYRSGHVLRVARRFFTHFDLYTLDPSGDLQRRSATATRAVDAQTVGREFIFDLSVEPGQTIPVLIYVETFQDSLQPLELWLQDADSFAASRAETFLVFGLIFGVLLALIFHNFVLYLNLRQRGHLFYVLAMTSTLLLLGVDSGMLQNFLLPVFLQPMVGRLNVLFAALLVITIYLFFRAFVEESSQPRRLIQWTRVGIVVLALMALAQLVVPPEPFAWLAISIQLLNVVLMLVVLVAAFVAARRGSTEGRIFLAAWSIYILSGVARTLLTLDLAGRNSVYEYLMYFAAVAEASILALGLSYRVRQLYERHATALKEQHKAAMLANLDPLTNAYNRRFLQTFLQNALIDREASSFQRSVLILDLDHFKEANDEYGHAAGDAILRELVRRCLRKLEDNGVLCRLGGDEFVIITSEQSSQSGLTLAQSILEEFRREPFVYEGKSMPVTISIGVVSTISPKSAVSDILRMADQALYQAKQSGRNRATLYDPDKATPFRHGPSMEPAREEQM